MGGRWWIVSRELWIVGAEAAAKLEKLQPTEISALSKEPVDYWNYLDVDILLITHDPVSEIREITDPIYRFDLECYGNPILAACQLGRNLIFCICPAFERIYIRIVPGANFFAIDIDQCVLPSCSLVDPAAQPDPGVSG